MNRIANLTLSAATALALAIAPLPATAGPDSDDIAKAVAGLVVLGIVAKAVSDKKNRRTNDAINQNSRIQRLGTPNNRSRSRILQNDQRRQQNQLRTNRRYKQAKLPDRCLRIADTGRRDQLVYGTRCLQNSYRYTNRLPQSCERFVWTKRGMQSVFTSRCLARDGWQVARR